MSKKDVYTTPIEVKEEESTITSLICHRGNVGFITKRVSYKIGNSPGIDLCLIVTIKSLTTRINGLVYKLERKIRYTPIEETLPRRVSSN